MISLIVKSIKYGLWLTIGLLAACSTNTQKPLSSNRSTSLSPAAAIAAANQTLQRASDADVLQKQDLKLQAANLFIKGGRTERAQRILTEIETKTLTANLNTTRDLLEAKIQLIENQPSAALQILSQIKTDTLSSTQQWRDYYQSNAIALQLLGNYLDSIKQRIALEHYIDNASQKFANQQMIWQSLEQIPTPQLMTALKANPTEELKAWLKLVLISKQNDANAAELSQAITQWRNDFPNHPANKLLPTGTDIPSLFPKQIKQIALLLPMHGKLAQTAQAIHNGFFAAYYQAQNIGQTIRLYDTSTPDDIDKIYQRAVQNGADVVVGPLQKNKLKQLVEHDNISVPTLALNNLANSMNLDNQNLFQFGLSPEDEAQQTAQRAWQDGHSAMMSITPNSPWGENIAKTFVNAWQNLGGKVTLKLGYNPQQNFSRTLSNSLNIKQSQARKHQIERIIKQKVEFVPRRRQDIDAVFITASPKIARTILPLLKFYYASDLTVYGTSMIYASQASRRSNRDLDGAKFCDIPLLLDQSASFSQRRKNLSKLWPNSYKKYPRLYALGADAYNLLTQLNSMALFNKVGIKANTGALYLRADNRIYRRLEWATIQKGLATQINQLPIA